jgi:hypothetical protein
MSQSDHVDEVKKVYETPGLVRWGTLREITQAVGNRGVRAAAEQETSGRASEPACGFSSVHISAIVPG